MITGHLTFKSAKATDLTEAEESVTALLSTLSKNGQIIGSDWPLAWEGPVLHAYVILPERHALQQKHSNKYVKKAYAKLREVGSTTIEIKVFDNPAGLEELHTRHTPSAYILYTTLLAIESPLTCGDCLAPIPLYTIPPTYDNSEYYDIKCWEADYQACDTLQMNCRNGEAFAIRQMSSPLSSLSQQGRDICSRIEVLTGIPTYYYLYRYVRRTTLARERERPCPVCGGIWLLPEPWHWFDFRCDTCRVVSTVSFTVKYD